MKRLNYQPGSDIHHFPRLRQGVRRNFALRISSGSKAEINEIDDNKGRQNDITGATEKSTYVVTQVVQFDKTNSNAIIGPSLGNNNVNSTTFGSTIPTQETTTASSYTTLIGGRSPPPSLASDVLSSSSSERVSTVGYGNRTERHHILPLVTRPRTTKKLMVKKRRRSSSNDSRSFPQFGLIKTDFSPVSFLDTPDDIADRTMSNLGKEDSGGYVIPPVLATENDGAAGVSRRLLDVHQISSRLHRSFPWEGLGLHNNNSTGSIGSILTTRIGFNPATTPHTLVFSSFYIVPLILLFGLVIALIWLLCACFYHTMQKIKLALCPGRRSNDNGDASESRRGKKGNKNSNKKSGNIDPCGGGSFNDVEKKPEILTPEILEMRRQERLAFLQAECANLEQQLTGLRASLPPQLQSSFEEKSATLTSRASDSDLEYLGASESPPLKRNSISLQDIPQSVIRIRREKELRQIKEEIEYLKTIAQQEKEKVAQAAKGLKGSFLITQDFELPASKPGSPNETKVEPLSQHISHLKTQRKLTEIRTELEDLAIQLLHADEIKAKRCSLQDLPRTALNIQREQHLITMTSEIQKMKNYKLQKKNLIETALEKSTVSTAKDEGNPSTGSGGNKPGSKSFINKPNESPSTIQDAAAKYSDPEFVHRSSIKRQREQELNRVRVELKDLAYKLNLNPMNYISEDRVRLVPSQSMQSTSSAAGQSSSYNRSVSTSSALNHV